MNVYWKVVPVVRAANANYCDVEGVEGSVVWWCPTGDQQHLFPKKQLLDFLLISYGLYGIAIAGL